ncbi:hypothetical protein KAU08_02445, partial [bacterium]|nr:hypothetical protein [bacterium]
GGFYKCLITVQDNDYNPNFPWIDMKAYQVVDVRVEGHPIAVAGADPNPQTINEPVYFWSYFSYDPDGGEIILHEWDWDLDGIYDETGPEAYHSWDTTGVYHVQFRVTDDEGKTDELDGPLEIFITELNPPLNVVDITPYWMKISPRAVCMDGDYAYIIADFDSLHIYDLSDKNNPVLLNSIVLSDGHPSNDVTDVITVSDGYAYIPFDEHSDVLRIIDIDPPEQAHIVNIIDLNSNPFIDLEVKDGYLYAGSTSWVKIVDIDPPESAHIVFEHEMTEYTYQTYDWDLGWQSYTVHGTANDIAIIGDYAYVVDFHRHLQHTSKIHMINIESPENAECVAVTDFNARNLDVYDNYLVIAGEDPLGDLTVWDVNENILINSIEIQPSILDVKTRMWIDPYGVAGLWDGPSCILVDFDPIQEAHSADVISSDCLHVNVDGNNGTACMVESTSIKVWDTEIPDSAYITAELDFIDDCDEIEISGEYIYVETGGSSDDHGQIAIIDILPLESAHPVSEINIDGEIKSIDYFNNQLFLYIALEWPIQQLQIYDVSSIENPVFILSIEVPASSQYSGEILVADGYLYYAGSGWLRIYDIDPLEEIYEVNSVEDVFRPVISNGYAYCSGSGSIIIVDIDPPETAHIVNTIDVGQNIKRAIISGNYLYAIGSISWDYTMLVFNLDSPEVPVQVHSFPVESPYDFITAGNLACVVEREGFKILDLSIPESTHVIGEVDILRYSQSAEIQHDKLYLTSETGVQVFDLW